MKKKYKVRSLPLHKKIIEEGVVSYQPYSPNSIVELSDEEFYQYKHLVEAVSTIKEK